MPLLAEGSPEAVLGPSELERGLRTALDALGRRRRALILPPDFTRRHSFAGELTVLAWEHYGERVADVMPAIGTHFPMTGAEIGAMFPGVPRGLFRVHDWRREAVTLGEAPADFVAEASEGRVRYAWPAQVNRRLVEGGYDLILSVGQVVPHEVAGMANYNKNVFVGVGGRDGIGKSHYLGAVYGMERIMGRADTPVRRVLDYASEHFAGRLPVVYVLTVVRAGSDGGPVCCGLFAGEDREVFERAAALSARVNIERLERPLRKVVCWLDPAEFKSTWLGNKSIYRTRMALADGGELVVLAPGVGRFGEDEEIDALIRKHGYCGTERVMAAVDGDAGLAANLSAAAHLIHGSTEGRFEVTYCAGGLTREEVEAVGYRWGDLGAMMERYPPARLRRGLNVLPGGEEVFYISNPALGLWAWKEKFGEG